MDDKAIDHFKKYDPLLYSAAIKVGALEMIPEGKPANYFLRLCREIVSQQLSMNAGETIFTRFKKLFGKGGLSPARVLGKSESELRSAGLSGSKARYIKNLARAVRNGEIKLERINSMSDPEIRSMLIKVKGIGPWTVDMFLLFTLVRPDVFSYGDLGLRKGIMKIYGFKNVPSEKKVETITKKWSPYKSIASRILWKYLELKNDK